MEDEQNLIVDEKVAVAWISAAIIFCCICMSVPIVHLVPLLTDRGISLNSATQVLMVLMFSGAFGRVLGGRLGDTIGALPAYMLMSLGQTISGLVPSRGIRPWALCISNLFRVYLLRGVSRYSSVPEPWSPQDLQPGPWA